MKRRRGYDVPEDVGHDEPPLAEALPELVDVEDSPLAEPSPELVDVEDSPLEGEPADDDDPSGAHDDAVPAPELAAVANDPLDPDPLDLDPIDPDPLDPDPLDLDPLVLDPEDGDDEPPDAVVALTPADDDRLDTDPCDVAPERPDDEDGPVPEPDPADDAPLKEEFVPEDAELAADGGPCHVHPRWSLQREVEVYHSQGSGVPAQS